MYNRLFQLDTDEDNDDEDDDGDDVDNGEDEDKNSDEDEVAPGCVLLSQTGTLMMIMMMMMMMAMMLMMLMMLMMMMMMRMRCAQVVSSSLRQGENRWHSGDATRQGLWGSVTTVTECPRQHQSCGGGQLHVFKTFSISAPGSSYKLRLCLNAMK